MMKNLLNPYKNFMNFVNNRLAEICGFLLFAIMILLTINVVTRMIGLAIPGLVTLSVLVMLAVVYLGMSRAEEQDEHANVDILPNLLPPKWNNLNSLVINILKLIAIGLFFYRSIFDFIHSYQTQEIFVDIVKIPIWPAKFAICIGLFFFALQILLKLLNDIGNLSSSRKS